MIMDNNHQYLPSIQSLHPSQGAQVQVIQLSSALSTPQALQDQQKHQEPTEQQQHELDPQQREIGKQQQEQKSLLDQSNSSQQSSPVSSQSKGSASTATLRRGPWSQEEDRLLLEAISMFGPSNWVRNSQALGSRTPKQCRERYHQNLKPSLNRNPITPEEGRLIEELVAKYGKRWAEIARHLNGRSDNAIKNWWNGGSNRRRRASLQAMVTPNNQQAIQPLLNTDYHINSQPSFNTAIFQPEQQQQQQQQSIHNNLLPPNDLNNQLNPLAQHQIPQSYNFAQQMLPPLTNSRSSSITQDHFQQQPGAKRLLDEQNLLPERRHSTQTILTSNGSSRNSSFSHDWNPNSNTPLSTSRRSSLAHEVFPGSFQHQARRPSYFSPTVQSARSSISGLSGGLTPLSISQYPLIQPQNQIPLLAQSHVQSQPQPQFQIQSQIHNLSLPLQVNPEQQQQQQHLQQGDGLEDKNLFKSNFDFSSKRKDSIKLPPPSSIHSNQSVTNSSTNSNSRVEEPVKYQISEAYRNSISNESSKWGNGYHKYQNGQLNPNFNSNANPNASHNTNHVIEYKNDQSYNNLNEEKTDKENNNDNNNKHDYEGGKNGVEIKKDVQGQKEVKGESEEVEGEGEKMNINNLLS